MKGIGNLVLCMHDTRSAPVTWLLPRNRLLVGPRSDIFFFLGVLFDGPHGMLSQPLFLVAFAQVLCFVRLLGDLLGSMLTKFLRATYGAAVNECVEV